MSFSNVNCPKGAEEVFEDWSSGLDYQGHTGTALGI